MDEMDAGAAYEMNPRQVVFEYRVNGEPRSAAIQGDALARIAGVGDLPTKAQHIAAYQKYWQVIHRVATELHDQGRIPVTVRVDDL